MIVWKWVIRLVIFNDEQWTVARSTCDIDRTLMTQEWYREVSVRKLEYDNCKGISPRCPRTANKTETTRNEMHSDTYFIWSEFNSRVHLSIFRCCECNASTNYLCIQRTKYDPRRCYTIFLTIFIHWLVYICWMGESLSATHTCVRFVLAFRL